MSNDISRVGEIILSVIGGVSGLIVGLILFISAFNTIGVYCPTDYSYYGPDYWLMLFGIISLSGGVIGIVSGAIFTYYAKIASILAIIASVLCLVGGLVVFGIVGFVLLLVVGILGFVRK
jgi:hypothetical protein